MVECLKNYYLNNISLYDLFIEDSPKLIINLNYFFFKFANIYYIYTYK